MPINDHDQVLWPDHCVQGTEGAALHPGLHAQHVDVIIRKGTDPRVDSYSGFRNNWNAAGERPPTGLAGHLRELGVAAVYVCGLARDVCVKWTAEDGADLGFDVTVIWDLTRPVDPTMDADVREALTASGVRLIESADLGVAR
jgi:nicotinamidase/pyrazinamidase